MTSPVLATDSPTKKPKMGSLFGDLFKSLAISGLLIFLFYIILFDNTTHNSLIQKWPIPITNSTNLISSTPDPNNPMIKTNLSHLVFSIVGSMNTWKNKRHYSEAWWRPNVTRGYLFLDKPPKNEFLPWPSSAPPFRVNEKVKAIYERASNPSQVRIVRTILEMVREGDENVRWYVMTDDDTVLALDNLVEVLSKYDHTKYHYIGTSSECIRSNYDFSFEMAFGGAGYALSYPLASLVASKLDGCLKRYPTLRVSDFMLYSCLADLGVALTHNNGFHQIDLHGDISGLLSAHPQTPFLSLHHIDTVDPIFPNKTRLDSIKHLMKAVKVDPSRVLQQTICHHRPTNWSISISWGYSTNIYEATLPRSFLRRPLETFRPWRGQRSSRSPFYMFNTRWPTNNPCETPHVFFFHSTQESNDRIMNTYVRASSPTLAPCGNHSANHIQRIRVFSPAKLPLESNGRDCCDVVYGDGENTTEVRYRACTKEDVTA
ncbi:uncharacterized protein LOC133034961 [Cannabis sativa]|uniref:uncharacterized protein LOC133034961 n=1 Tax=Cannabis sativa TaxID=3483 RepID=UPI0029CA5C43|nr:uncharacterized protein LOC133034961 [Cannabis sativa]